MSENKYKIILWLGRILGAIFVVSGQAFLGILSILLATLIYATSVPGSRPAKPKKPTDSKFEEYQFFKFTNRK